MDGRMDMVDNLQQPLKFGTPAEKRERAGYSISRSDQSIDQRASPAASCFVNISGPRTTFDNSAFQHLGFQLSAIDDRRSTSSLLLKAHTQNDKTKRIGIHHASNMQSYIAATS